MDKNIEFLFKDKFGNMQAIEAKRIPNSLSKLREMLDEQLFKYAAVYLTNQQIYGERAASVREAVWSTNRIQAIWQHSNGAVLILGPDTERTDKVLFIYDEDFKKTIAKGVLDHTTLPYYQVSKSQVPLPYYQVSKSQVRPGLRIDFDYYNPEYTRFEKEMEEWPTLDSICQHISYGYHANPKKDSIKPDEPGQEMNFLGISNISPHGYLIGDLPIKKVRSIPKTSIVTTGDFVVSLFGGNLKKKTLGAIGRTAVVGEENSPAFINQTMASIRLKPGIDPYYVLLSLKSDYFQKQLLQRMKPANNAQTLVTLKDFRKCRIKMSDPKIMEEIDQSYKELINSFKNEQLLLKQVESI